MGGARCAEPATPERRQTRTAQVALATSAVFAGTTLYGRTVAAGATRGRRRRSPRNSAGVVSRGLCSGVVRCADTPPQASADRSGLPAVGCDQPGQGGVLHSAPGRVLLHSRGEGVLRVLLAGLIQAVE